MSWIPMALGAAGIGAQLYGASQDKTETKQMSKLNAQQKRMQKILQQQAESRLGQWIKTPKGMVFHYNPELPPVYPGQRMAPMTGMRQQSLQQGFGAGQIQQDIMNRGAPNYTGQLANYQPGNMQSLTGGMRQMPTTQGRQPYQINQMALTGQGPAMPEVERTDEYFAKNWRLPQSYLDPYAVAQDPDAWKGKMSQDVLANLTRNTPLWQPEYNRMPSFGQARRTVNKANKGKDISSAYGQLSPYFPQYAQGGQMPEENKNQDMSQFNLVGEQGPEMHVTPTGQQNMVGEQGPELFNPNQAGYIIPNNQLPPGINAQNGPQSPTGQEQPLPQGRMPMLPAYAEGGNVPAENTGYYYDPGGQEWGIPDFGEDKGAWRDWKSDEGADAYSAVSMAAGKPSGLSWNKWGPSTTAYVEPIQRTDWGSQDWSYTPESQTWATAGTADQWTPGATYTPQGYTGGNMQYNYATGQWEMPQGAMTNQYSQPFENWQWAEPPENAAEGSVAMWAPQGYQYPLAPVETPTGDVIEAPTEPLTPSDTGAGNGTGSETQQLTIPEGATYDAMPDLGLQTDWQAPQQTGFEYWQANAPEEYNAMLDYINNPTPTYNYDPNQINQQFNQMVYDPAMQSWQEYTAPYLREQFARTGNVVGSEMPQYLTRQAGDLARTLEGQRFQAQQTGQQRGFEAAEAAQGRKAEMLGMLPSMASTSAAAKMTDAQVDNIYNTMNKDNLFAGAEMETALKNIDWQTATTNSIYDKLTSANPLMSDKAKIENMVSAAYLDGMETSNLRAELGAVHDMLVNAGLEAALGAYEEERLQNLYTWTYADWVNAMESQGKLQNAQDMILQMLGMPTTENVIYQPSSTGMDMSWLGALAAQ